MSGRGRKGEGKGGEYIIYSHICMKIAKREPLKTVKA
jgi:hypothetical protein